MPHLESLDDAKAVLVRLESQQAIPAADLSEIAKDAEIATNYADGTRRSPTVPTTTQLFPTEPSQCLGMGRRHSGVCYWGTRLCAL